ncbi:dynamin family protein [Calothrix sp. NIES-3974]|uniref:dynamin family protein n=1 Tax=Calothrix sp. NIES-3974 TaxID=2005462 RepID=UPI000B5F8CCF|nr:dynamin family protein [Calothrix sp. NIES-3974]BAZ06613.1 hypothetical protein NIES3974_32740 [Calothrix sp. NIES-3974]
MNRDNAVEQLRHYQEYGESILHFINAAVESPPPKQSWVQTSINESIQRLKYHAQRTVEIAASPVKIGIMGEFSSGKTLLIGSLIGYADALPVSETPTTGNVTAIRLIQQAEFKTTEVGEFTVRYLTHEGVRECLRYMLKEVETRASVAKFPPAALTTLRSLQPTTFVDSKSILAWCEQAWNQTQSLELRSLLRELVVFVRTYTLFGIEICGKSYRINRETANQGLRLAEPPMNILELGFERIPIPYKQWDGIDRPNVDDLRNTFSLIGRIDVTVEVSREIWDLSALQGTNELILLDFPGLGAADSSVRDTFLSLRELAEVQTILLLLNGRYPGGATASKIRTMLEQDKGEDLKERIIVGVGRFNQLPLTVAEERAIDSLLSSHDLTGDESIFSVFAEPLSEEMVLEQIPILKLTMASASNLTTQPKNIVLLSQLYGLSKLDELSSLLQICSPEFKSELEQLLQTDDWELRDKWRRLGEQIIPSGYLHKQICDFADDGGLARLRGLLNEHVTIHGMQQLLEDVQRVAADLRTEQLELEKILQEVAAYIPAVENPSFVTLRQGIENLVTIYRQYQAELEQQPILTNRTGIAVSELVKNELTHKIFFDWSEWNILFDRTKGGKISLNKVMRFFEEDEADDPIPTQGDDFYPVFVQTVDEMQEFAHSRMSEAVADWFSKLAHAVETERSKIDLILQPQMEAYIQENFGNRSTKLFRNLIRAIDPVNKWQQMILTRSGLTENTTPINANALFPLARRDARHQIGQIFDWSPHKKYPSQGRPFNHQIAVLRLRNEITASLGLHLVQYVSLLTQQTKSSFSVATKEIVDSLQDLLKSKNEPLLRYIAAAEDKPVSSQPAWLENLSQLVAVSFPGAE